ncbi:MAG: carbohydrate porin [Deltaproteobacteria bacterium]|nr:MAG: carbohydrate porin [Deltaproteobacteria bacterium]
MSNYDPQHRIARLVADYGSDDRLVKAVNAKLGTRLTRQMVIRWRTGRSGLSNIWAERMAEFTGGRPEDFRLAPMGWRKTIEQRLDELERRLQELENRNG